MNANLNKSFLGPFRETEINKTGQAFRNKWSFSFNRNKVVRNVTDYSRNFPIFIEYPEVYSFSIKPVDNSKKRNLPLEINNSYICDFCQYSADDTESIHNHLTESGHLSFSLYNVTNDKTVVLIKPKYFVNLEEHYNKYFYFMCPYCKLLFSDKFQCGYHVKLSHNSTGWYYSMVSVNSFDITFKHRNYACLQCKTKDLQSFNELLQHWDKQNFRCCELLSLYRGFKGFYVVMCSDCESYSADTVLGTNHDRLPNNLNFVRRHGCFSRKKNPNIGALGIEIRIDDLSKVPVRRVHDLRDEGCQETVILKMKLCEDVYNSIKNSAQFNTAFVDNILDEGDRLWHLFNFYMSIG